MASLAPSTGARAPRRGAARKGSVAAAQRARQDTQPPPCRPRPGLPAVRPPAGRVPGAGGASLGKCRDMLPGEAKDLGWVRPTCCCFSCLGWSGRGPLPGGLLWRAEPLLLRCGERPEVPTAPRRLTLSAQRRGAGLPPVSRGTDWSGAPAAAGPCRGGVGGGQAGARPGPSSLPRATVFTGATLTWSVQVSPEPFPAPSSSLGSRRGTLCAGTWGRAPCCPLAPAL